MKAELPFVYATLRPACCAASDPFRAMVVRLRTTMIQTPAQRHRNYTLESVAMPPVLHCRDPVFVRGAVLVTDSPAECSAALSGLVGVMGYTLSLQSRCGYRSGDCRNACFRPVTEQLNLLESRRSDAEACIRRRKLPLIPSIF